MSNSGIEIFKVLYHQEIVVHFGIEGRQCRLAHCDKAFVTVNHYDSWLSKNVIQQICFKLYSQWITKDEVLVALLELNVMPLDEPNTKSLPIYSHLVGIISPISNDVLPNACVFYSNLLCFCSLDQNGIICVVLDSILGSGNKCFEISTNCCYQVPYHIISSTASLCDYKYLVVDSLGWLFVVTPNMTSCHLILEKEYVAIASDQTICMSTSKHCNQSSSQNKNINSIKEIQNGSGLLVSYGAIITNLNTLPDFVPFDAVFIGHTDGIVKNFTQIQNQTNGNYSIGGAKNWPEFAKSILHTKTVKSVTSADGHSVNDAVNHAEDDENTTYLPDKMIELKNNKTNNINQHQKSLINDDYGGSGNGESTSIDGQLGTNIMVTCFQTTPVVYYGTTSWCYNSQYSSYNNNNNNNYFNGY